MQLNRVESYAGSMHYQIKVNTVKAYETILTAYITSPLRRKGSSSSNSSVLYLRTTGIMHCSLRFKYHNFSRLMISSPEFGEVAVKVLLLPPPLVTVDPISYIYTPLVLAVTGVLP